MEPSVAAILLARDRPELSKRAVACFRSQGYPFDRRSLVIYDGGDGSWYEDKESNETRIVAENPDAPIGALRNAAIRCAPRADVILTWDSDDLSHPQRIEEQVAFLQSSGAAIVGYRDLLFRRNSETWLYRSPEPQYPVGATLCFWRRTWEMRPYPALSTQEDFDFVLLRKVVTTSSIVDGEPRMIALIHGANTNQKSYEALLSGALEFRRTPEWDGYQIPTKEQVWTMK